MIGSTASLQSRRWEFGGSISYAEKDVNSHPNATPFWSAPLGVDGFRLRV
jgi:hypothetical protein